MATNQNRRSKSDWVSGAQPNPDPMDMANRAMSDEQAHRLKALCWQRGERFDSSLSAAEADRRIAELEARG